MNDIKKELEEADTFLRNSLMLQYQKDNRAGVKKLLLKYEKEEMNLRKERERTWQMQSYEREYRQYSNICGIDEVGRGPLAGPVVAGAVILKKDCDILYINDSKKLSEKKREQLSIEIMDKAVAVGIGIVPPSVIDRINILNATYEAMRKAMRELLVKPDFLLNDAVYIPGISIPQKGIVKGDAKSLSIAAASIVAKVARDRMMMEYDALYPTYHFAGNKGYGSAEHIKAIKQYGPCPIHRKSFIKNFTG